MFASSQTQIWLARLITLVIAFTFHELAHALVADRLGDPTPRLDGRITLNPLKHLDPFGSLMLLLSGFGWAKPVQIRPDLLNRENKAGVMLVSFSGPLSNLLLAGIGALLLRGVSALRWLDVSYGTITTLRFFTQQFIYINLGLALFNLIPLAPLDGEKVLAYFLPASICPGWDKVQQYGMQILLVCMLVLPYFGINLFGKFLSPLINGLYRLITGG